jgi:hypothetical protein
VPGAPREHGGEEGLEGPEVGEGVGAECAAAGESLRSAYQIEGAQTDCQGGVAQIGSHGCQV